MALADQINQYLRGKGSPLAGYGNQFVSAGQKYGIDPRFLVAISGGETGFGTYKPSQGIHNAWGLGPNMKFGSWDEGINYAAQNLTKSFYKGKNTIGQIGATWAPSGAANDPNGLNNNWAKNVGKFYSELGGNTGASVRTTPGQQQIADAIAPQQATAAPGLQSSGTSRQDIIMNALMARRQSGGTAKALRAALIDNRNSSAGNQAAAGADAAADAVDVHAIEQSGDTDVVAAAKAQLGIPYSWGGGTPSGPSKGFAQGANTVGFDCSSLVQYAWAKRGVNLPRTTYDQIKSGTAVKSLADARPGDLIFPSNHHVQMYLGNGKVIEAPNTGGHVQISNYRGSIAIRRPG